MNNHTSTNFDGSQNLDSTHRRRFQNRIAQRKYREKIKAQRQTSINSISGGREGGVIPDDNAKDAYQIEPVYDAVNDMLHDWNTPGSANEVQDQLVLPQTMANIKQGHQRQELQSLGPNSLPGQESQESQSFNDQFLTLDRAGRDDNSEMQFLRSKNNLSQPRQGSVRGGRAYMNNGNDKSLQHDPTATKQAAAVVQNQRARICDQAEQYLERLISLYDFGVSLDILDADSRLRDHLVNASRSFDIQRSVESQGIESDDFVESW